MRIAWEMEERGEICALGNALRLEAEEVVRRDGGEKPLPRPLPRREGRKRDGGKRIAKRAGRNTLNYEL